MGFRDCTILGSRASVLRTRFWARRKHVSSAMEEISSNNIWLTQSIHMAKRRGIIVFTISMKYNRLEQSHGCVVLLYINGTEYRSKKREPSLRKQQDLDILVAHKTFKAVHRP